MKILVIAPHPDDEVLGCGGTIAKYSQKREEVYLCIVTKGYTPDWSEEYIRDEKIAIEKANKILGIKKTCFLDFPTAKLDTVPQKELNNSISKIINEIKPETVYIPHRGDLSRDHRLVFEAALVATRPINSSSVKKILSYETPSETEWGKGFEQFVPNIYEDISGQLEIKLEAMKSYKDEIREFPHLRSLAGLSILAKKRGSEAGLLAAEAFVLIRDIKK